jgi:hypothetical protein
VVDLAHVLAELGLDEPVRATLLGGVEDALRAG